MKHELLYTSLAVREMNTDDLTGLLAQSREKNARLKITGLLIYSKREFMQLLEGNKEDIFELYNTIVKDERHQQVKLLWDGEIEDRSFKDWSMAFLNIDGIEQDKLDGYSRFLQQGLASLHLTGNQSIGRRLLIDLRDEFL
jgi:hypothetical protein